MTKFFKVLVLLMFTGILANAQTKTIKGSVSDPSGAPVQFASVTEPGTRNTARADENGVFEIKVKTTTSELLITAASFTGKSFPINGLRCDAVLTASNNTELAGVTVNSGLGRRRLKAELGYAAASLAPKELTQANAVNVQNALTGKVSGLNINTVNSGVLGNNVRITLRNIRSLTGNNQPLLLLDGIPISLSYISSINPNDIEDLTVLKSAASTAIYGPDGVNGAIAITTKKGRKGAPQITFSQATQFEQIAYLPNFQNRFGSGYDQDPNTGEGTFKSIEQQSWGSEFDGSIKQFGQTGPNGEKFMGTYDYKQNGRRNFFQTGITNQTDLSYSAENFYLSAQNVDIKGTVKNDANRRRSITMRTEKTFNKFKAIFNARYTNNKFNVASQPRLIYYNVTSAPGQYDLGQLDDWKNDYFSSPDGFYTTYLDNTGKTAAFLRDNQRTFGTNNDILGNIQLDFKPVDNLKFTYRLGTTITSGSTTATVNPYKISAFAKTLVDPMSRDIPSSISESSELSSRINSEIIAEYTKKFGNIGMILTAGQSYRLINSKTQNINGALGFSDFLTIVNRNGEPNVSIGGSTTKLDRYFGSAEFSYKDWLTVAATISADRDSRFVSKNKNFTNKDIRAVYPGVNASVLLHKLAKNMLGEGHTVSFLKLRGAIAKTGSAGQLGAFQNESRYFNSGFFPFGNTQGLVRSTQLISSNFKPEFVNTKEAGLEIGFLKNKVVFEASYYNQNNTNQIVNVNLSTAAGYSSYLRNAASFSNNGLELDLRLTPLVKLGEVQVGVKLNYTYQTSKVTSIIPGLDELGIGSNNYAIVGQPVYKFKLTDYNRDPATGKVIVDKGSGMPSINSNLTEFGRTTPDNIFGASVNVDWKNISFVAVLDYRTGNEVLADDLGAFLDDNGISARSADNGRRAFVFPNSVYEVAPGKYADNTNIYTRDYGRIFYNGDLNNNVQTNYLADGSFFKVRELSLSYNFPASIFSKSKVVKAASFGVTARNLITWRPASNQWTDPEFASGTGNAQGSSSAAQLPPTRIFGANLKLTF
jgi:TonB-linked SusC/RagA family outer membrane protein